MGVKMIQKRWFHATTKENWKKIQKEKMLWGIDRNQRHTFLARSLKELISMVTDNHYWNSDMHNNELVLSVKYTPNNINDDYNVKSWEMVVKKPITLDNIQLLKYI